MNDTDFYVQRADELFHQGCYSCAQSVAAAFADCVELDEQTLLRLASPFGGGVGRLRELCGAVSGMLFILGLQSGYTDAQDTAGKQDIYARTQLLAGRFEALHGSIICRELLDRPREGSAPEARTQEYYDTRPCACFVRDAARILADYLHNPHD